MAENKFKNIKVLTGTKASDLLPAMQFMSASLKVDCDYCHTQDRASDDKKEKESARKMIVMTKQINETNFGGRLQVICATCHAGHTHPIGTPPVPGAADRLRNSNDLNPDKIIADYDAAAGGPAAAKAAALQLDGTSVSDGKSQKLRMLRMGDKFLISHDDSEHNMKLGYNGTEGWFSAGGKANPVPSEVISGFAHMTAVYTGKGSLPTLSNMRAGTGKIDGMDVVGIRGETADKLRVTLFFDKKSNLLVRALYLTPTILGSIPLECDYSDFKKVDGIQVATHIQIHGAEGDEDIKIHGVQIETNIAASAFDMPK